MIDNSYLAEFHKVEQSCTVQPEKVVKTIQASLEKEEEPTVGVSTASEEHSSNEDNGFHFNPAELGGTMIGVFSSDMFDEEFNSDD